MVEPVRRASLTSRHRRLKRLAASRRRSADEVDEGRQLHKMRNAEDYLPNAKRAYALAQMRQAYKARTASSTRKLPVQLASWLERRGHENAAGPLREGLEERLTLLKLGLSRTLTRSLSTTHEHRRKRHELHPAHDENRQALAQLLEHPPLGRNDRRHSHSQDVGGRPTPTE